MLPSNLELLNHIIDEISFIEHSVINKNRDEVSDDPYYLGQLLEVWKSLKLVLKLTSISNCNIHILNGGKCQTQEIV